MSVSSPITPHVSDSPDSPDPSNESELKKDLVDEFFVIDEVGSDGKKDEITSDLFCLDTTPKKRENSDKVEVGKVQIQVSYSLKLY